MADGQIDLLPTWEIKFRCPPNQQQGNELSVKQYKQDKAPRIIETRQLLIRSHRGPGYEASP